MNDSFDPRDRGTDTPSPDATPPTAPTPPAAEPPQPPIAPPTPPVYAPPVQPTAQPPYGQPPVQPTAQPPYGQPPAQAGYTQPPYNQPPYAPYYPPIPQPPKKNSNGMAIASMLCGIASLVICCCAGFAPLLGGLAILFALLSRKGDDRFSGMALTGLICGSIGAVLGVLLLVAAVNGTLEEWSTYMYEYEEELQNFAFLFLR